MFEPGLTTDLFYPKQVNCSLWAAEKHGNKGNNSFWEPKGDPHVSVTGVYNSADWG